VSLGRLSIDYGKLLWQKTVALSGVPHGQVRIVLNAQDLANFMAHPVMLRAASRIVEVPRPPQFVEYLHETPRQIA
jgi:hypothetical protein